MEELSDVANLTHPKLATYLTVNNKSSGLDRSSESVDLVKSGESLIRSGS